ncbi:hypothetical protein [Nitratifractor sp.]|uniref:hypothetical protein n=1 Tax=Nitratifractor sp. TaxID=2268144 RepID=UPI0025FE209B|nr:hypothetical protein [Nitratifractor sp.]
MKPPRQRINFEYERLKKRMVDQTLLIGENGRRMSKEEFIRTYDPVLWDYLCSIYSYDNNCSIKIYKCSAEAINKINTGIQSEDFARYNERARRFSETDVEIGEYYLSKIDVIANPEYKKIWYVSFKEANYPFGFEQHQGYIATVKSNVFVYGDFLVMRGQANMLPGMSDAFFVDFGISRREVNELTSYSDMLGLFIKLKEDGTLNLKTAEKTMENPIGGIPAEMITFSVPTGGEGDIDEYDMEDEVAQMLDEAPEVSRVLTYCHTDTSGYTECGKIAIGRGANSIRVLGKMSDLSLLSLVSGVSEKIIELQENETDSDALVADTDQ